MHPTRKIWTLTFWVDGHPVIFDYGCESFAQDHISKAFREGVIEKICDEKYTVWPPSRIDKVNVEAREASKEVEVFTVKRRGPAWNI